MPDRPLAVVWIGRDSQPLKEARRWLDRAKDASIRWSHAPAAAQAAELLADESWDAVVLQAEDAAAARRVVDAARPQAPVIALVDQGDSDVDHDPHPRIVDFITRDPFNPHLLIRAIQLAAARSRTRLLEELISANRAEVRIARTIQERLLPWVPPTLPRGRIAGASIPTEEVGGDYFDYLHLADGGFAVAVGDASGHGLGPAILMAQTRAALHALARSSSDPAVILTEANELLSGSMPENRFVSLLLACFDPAMSSLTYASAGHPAGYVIDPAGDVRLELPATGFPLGISDEPVPAVRDIALMPGDLLLLMTDGVVEARSPRLEMFGPGRTLALVRRHRRESPLSIINHLTDAIRVHCAPSEPEDDITAVVLKLDEKKE